MTGSSVHASTNSTVRFHFQVQCPVERALLKILRRFVTNVAEEMGFEADDIYKIEMAVDEACANVAIHAYAGGHPDPAHGEIQLCLALQEDALIIQIEDRGRGGSPEAFRGCGTIADYQRLDRDQYHGLGTVIMREFMDEVEFNAHPKQGTRVLLRKFLKKKHKTAPLPSLACAPQKASAKRKRTT